MLEGETLRHLGVVDQDTQLFRELLHLTGYAACEILRYVFFLILLCLSLFIFITQIFALLLNGEPHLALLLLSFICMGLNLFAVGWKKGERQKLMYWDTVVGQK